MMTPRRTLETSLSSDDQDTSTEEHLICREHFGEDGAANLQIYLFAPLCAGYIVAAVEEGVGSGRS
jgi:hypothetical protein